MKPQEFLSELPDLVRDHLPTELHNFHVAPRETSIAKLYFTNPKIHYEVWIRRKYQYIEIALHFEADRKTNQSFLELLETQRDAINSGVLSNLRIEPWEKGWTRAYQIIPWEPLERFPEFVEFRTPSAPRKPSIGSEIEPSPDETTGSPEDLLASAYLQVRSDLEIELLQQIKDSPPAFFEQLVVDLLVAMGYGGSRQDAGQALGRSGDEGIDGVINEDHLGLDVIYVQAKRWENTVGRPEIQKFAGALQGQRARKGVFITTANFSKEAEAYPSNIDAKIILIDGVRLVQLMVDHGVGVLTTGVYEVKKIDGEYFPFS